MGFDLLSSAEGDVHHLRPRKIDAGSVDHGYRIHARAGTPERNPIRFFASDLQPLRLLLQSWRINRDLREGLGILGMGDWGVRD